VELYSRRFRIHAGNDILYRCLQFVHLLRGDLPRNKTTGSSRKESCMMRRPGEVPFSFSPTRQISLL
jgi:hypothetical protein